MRTPYQSYSPAEWQKIMTHYAGSGLNQKAFCQREGLAMSTFSKWRKQLGLIHTKATMSKEVIADFKPLAPISLPAEVMQAEENENAARDWEVELALGAGVVLRLRATG